MGERLSSGASVRRPNLDNAGADAGGEETLVIDARGQMRPAEMVERKLVNMLRGVPMPVSNVSAAAKKR